MTSGNRSHTIEQARNADSEGHLCRLPVCIRRLTHLQVPSPLRVLPPASQTSAGPLAPHLRASGRIRLCLATQLPVGAAVAADRRPSGGTDRRDDAGSARLARPGGPTPIPTARSAAAIQVASLPGRQEPEMGVQARDGVHWQGSCPLGAAAVADGRRARRPASAAPTEIGVPPSPQWAPWPYLRPNLT